MKVETEKKILAGFSFLMTLAIIYWSYCYIKETSELYESAKQSGWALEISFDPQERHERLTIAFILLSISILSRKATGFVLIFFGILYSIFEIFNFPPKSEFLNRAEPEFHLAASILLIVGILLWFRKKNYILISSLISCYILFEYLIWFIRTRKYIDEGMQFSILHHVFEFAQWWHLAIFIAALLIFAGQIKLYLKRRFNEKDKIK